MKGGVGNPHRRLRVQLTTAGWSVCSVRYGRAWALCLYIMMTESKKGKQNKKKNKGKKAKQKPNTRPTAGKGKPLHVTTLGDRYGTNQLALAMALPCEHGGFRFPTRDMPRCSVVSGKDIYAVSNTNNTSTGWNLGDFVLHVYGQPGRACVYTKSSAAPSHYYDMYMASGTLDFVIAPFAVALSESPLTLGEFAPWVGGRSSLGNTGLHGPTIACGMSNGIGYVLCGYNVYLAVQLTTWTSTATGQAYFEVWRYRGLNQQPVLMAEKSITLVGGQIPATNLIDASMPHGYYAVKFDRLELLSGAITSGSNAIRLRLNPSANPLSESFWSQVTMSELDPNGYGDIKIAESTRVTGMSALLTNTSSLYNAAGTIVAARTRSALFTDISKDTLSRCAEKYTNPTRLGVYTFKEFTDTAEKFVCCAAEAANFLVFDLDYEDFIYTVQAGCNDPVNMPNTFELVLEYAVEFVTEAQRYTKGVPRLPFESLVEARRLINSKPEWFYENPLHMADIYRLIRKGVNALAKGAVTAAPYAGKAAAAIDPARAGMYNALAEMIGGLRVR